MSGNHDLKLFFKNLTFLTLFYFGAFVLLQIFSYYFLNGRWLLNVDSFLNADAEHYYYISQRGYEGFRFAFFPLFPLLWKLIGVGIFPIVLLNTLLFLICFSAITSLFKIENKTELILLASFPCFIFMFIAYTEALFFLFSTMLLLGLKKNNPGLVCFGIFFCGLTRPTAAVFIPAIILTIYFGSQPVREKISKGFLYSLFALLGLGAAIIIQRLMADEWLSFFEVQKGWGNELRIPKLPFTSWAGGKIVRLDASALLVGFFAAAFLVKTLAAKLNGKHRTIPPEAVFSISYLAGVSILILLFRGGSFFSLNRFVFATAFFIVAFMYFLSSYSFSYKEVGIFIVISAIFWLLFASYVHIQYLLKFFVLSLYLAMYFLLNNKNIKLKRVVTFGIIIINSILLMYFYYRYLTNEWVG